MRKQRKMEWRVLFWHNDFADGSRSNSFFGKEGPIAQRVVKNIAAEASLKWHFHGGFMRPERKNLFRRLREADVLFVGTPANMDMADDKMHWLEATSSLLNILQAVKKENKGLKIFFLHEPDFMAEEFQKLGEVASDIHEDVIYDYFRKH